MELLHQYLLAERAEIGRVEGQGLTEPGLRFAIMAAELQGDAQTVQNGGIPGL